MAKQKNSRIDSIIELLDNSFLDSSSTLKEEDTTAKGVKFKMERKIVGSRTLNYVLFRYDPNKTKLFPYFSQQSGLKKICDYIMFVEEGSNLFVLTIEMKLGTASASKQLSASECFIDFIMSSAKRIGKDLTGPIHCIKVRVSERRSQKRNRTTKHSLQFDENRIINYDHSQVFRIQELIDTIS